MIDIKKLRADPDPNEVISIQDYLDYLNYFVNEFFYGKSDIYTVDIDGTETKVDCEWLYNNSSSAGLEARVAALEAKLPDLPDATPLDTPYVLTGEKDD